MKKVRSAVSERKPAVIRLREILPWLSCAAIAAGFYLLLWRVTRRDPASGLSVLALLSGLAVHEAGHLLSLAVLRRKRRGTVGRKREKACVGVRFRPWGIELRGGEWDSYGQEIGVSLLGPGGNLLVGACLLLLRRTTLWQGGYGCFFLERLCESCFLFAALNLLPIEGLDGGSALRALLLLRTRLPPDAVERILRTLSFFLLIPLWLFSLCVLIASNGNLSFFALCACLFLELYQNRRV